MPRTCTICARKKRSAVEKAIPLPVEGVADRSGPLAGFGFGHYMMVSWPAGGGGGSSCCLSPRTRSSWRSCGLGITERHQHLRR